MKYLHKNEFYYGFLGGGKRSLQRPGFHSADKKQNESCVADSSYLGMTKRLYKNNFTGFSLLGEKQRGSEIKEKALFTSGELSFKRGRGRGKINVKC